MRYAVYLHKIKITMPKLILGILACGLFFAGCKQNNPATKPHEVNNERKLFYGEIIYSSVVATPDSALAISLNTFSPYEIAVYIDTNKFRMIEKGGLSHANVIIFTDVKEAWQLDTAKMIAHLGEYSDLGDPSSALKTTMPDHFEPTIEKTADTAIICGQVCEKYKIIRSGFIPIADTAFIWVAKNIDFPPARYDIQTEINRSAVPAPLYLGYEDGAVMRLEIISKSYTRTFEVIQLKEQYFPSGIFEIPSNYQKK